MLSINLVVYRIKARNDTEIFQIPMYAFVPVFISISETHDHNNNFFTPMCLFSQESNSIHVSNINQ